MNRFIKVLLIVVSSILGVSLTIFAAFASFMIYLTYVINTSGFEDTMCISGDAVPSLESPSITTDTVYFRKDDELVGIDAVTGKLKMRFRGTPWCQVVNGKIYQLDMESVLYILDPSSRREKKRLKTSIKAFGKCIEYENKLLFKGNGKSVYAYSLDTGKNLWKFTASDDIENYLVVGSGIACFGTMPEGVNPANPEIYGIDINSGKKLWNFKADYPYISVYPNQSVSSGKVVYVESMSRFAGVEGNGSLDAIDILTGKRIWRFTPDSGCISGDPAIFNEFMYVGSSDNKFYAIDLKTGHKTWSFSGSKVGDEYIAKAAADVNYAYFASIDNYLYAIDRNNGKVRWKTNKLGDISDSNPSAMNGFVYIGTKDTLFALDRQTGKTEWKFKVK